MKIGNAFVLLLMTMPLSAQYAGPAILARGEAPAAMSLPQINFQPFLEASGVYQQGLGGVTINEQGELGNERSYGAGLTWGIGGVHSWRHTKLGLDYRGMLMHYAQSQGFDSLDQSLMMGLKHQFSPHVSANLEETAGITNRDFGQRGLRQTVPFDPSTTYVPVTDYFDNRTVYSTTDAALEFQRSTRLSFDMGGIAFLVRRRSSALIDTNGLTAHGDVQYRVSRRSTIGFNYSFLHFTYGGIQGATDAHGISASYSIRLTRYTEFSAYAGVYRIESTFLQETPVDPVITALLGVTSTAQLVNRINYTPQAAARFSRIYRTGMLFIGGGHSVTPGNGVFLTSIVTNGMGGYSYTGLRRWSFGVLGGYTDAKSIGTVTGKYSLSEQRFQLSREIAPHVHLIASYSARQYRSPDYNNYSRNITDARIGIGYSPGEIPLRIW